VRHRGELGSEVVAAHSGAILVVVRQVEALESAERVHKRTFSSFFFFLLPLSSFFFFSTPTVVVVAVVVSRSLPRSISFFLPLAINPLLSPFLRSASSSFYRSFLSLSLTLFHSLPHLTSFYLDISATFLSNSSTGTTTAGLSSAEAGSSTESAPLS
jgi:hypothetical protein